MPFLVFLGIEEHPVRVVIVVLCLFFGFREDIFAYLRVLALGNDLREVSLRVEQVLQFVGF